MVNIISVLKCRNGVFSAAISLSVQLAPAMSQEMVNNLYAALSDVWNRILDFFNVDSEDGEKVDALVGVLEDTADHDAPHSSDQFQPSRTEERQRCVGYRRAVHSRQEGLRTQSVQCWENDRVG